MEPMKQCPNCGKYVPADKTYCMSCGTTLGIRCPGCQKVLPLGSKTCPGCGHSFVRKGKKQSSRSRLWIKKRARSLLCALLVLCTLAVIVLAALPTLRFTLTETGRAGETVTVYQASGYTLIGFLLGAHPADVTALLDMPAFSELSVGLRFALYGEGAGWLAVLCGLALCLILLFANLRHMGRDTAHRLLLPADVTAGGAVLTLSLDLVVRHLVTQAAAKTWALPLEDTAETGQQAALTVPYAVGAAAPILLTVTAILLLGGMVYLYLDVFRREEEAGELSLPVLLKTPFVWVVRSLHRLLRTVRKKKDSPTSRDERTVICTRRFTSYLILLGVSLIFTQALLSKVSHIFFWFMLLLPGVLLVYACIARHALTVRMLSESATTEKNTPYTYEFTVSNRSILAFPFIEAQISIPQSNSVRCTERTVRLAMAPLSNYQMKNTVRFRFRGTYDIGVRCFYVYDFFRLFRVQVPIEAMTTVYVLPHRLSLGDSLALSVSDSTARTVRSPLVVDKLEVSDIRDYRAGDPLKSIHWKLSSKSESFIVKDYNTGTSNQTIIFCDLAAHFPDEPPKASPTGEPNEQRGKKARRSRKEMVAMRKAEQDKQLLRSSERRRIESEDTHAISDEDLEKRLSDRAEAVRLLSSMQEKSHEMPIDTPADTGSNASAASDPPSAPVNVQELASPTYYDDMNEYLADGVVELTIARVLTELNQGHEVLLLWFDRRADTGVFAFSLRGADEFERIYHLFGTAPLCPPAYSVTQLVAMVGDTENAKQLFAVSVMDNDMLTGLSGLPGVSDAANFGSAEVLLYNPEERFLHPKERAMYLEGCREQLEASGLTLNMMGIQDSRSEKGETEHE